MAFTHLYLANNTLYLKYGVVILALTMSNTSSADGVSGIINRNISNDISRELRERVLRNNKETKEQEKQQGLLGSKKNITVLSIKKEGQVTEDVE